MEEERLVPIRLMHTPTRDRRLRLQHAPNSIPASGSILDVVGVCVNRIGTERLKTWEEFKKELHELQNSVCPPSMARLE
jgi:hypothetical protein